MTKINDVLQGELIERSAQELKSVKEIEVPIWASFVKTGVSKMRPPVNKDWWYTRSASVLLKIYNHGPIGVSKLRTYYGSKKNRGVQPEKFFKGSGNIIRKVLQQLEKGGLAKQEKAGSHKGRIITKQGKEFLDKIAAGLVTVKPKAAPETPKVEKEEKAQKKEESKPKVKEEKKSED